MKVLVVLTAAGQSRRMGGLDKLLLKVHGRPLLAETARLFFEWERLLSMVVAVSPGREESLERILLDHAPAEAESQLHVVPGGAERQDSIRGALEHLASHLMPPPEMPVLIHDAARPFLDHPFLEKLLGALHGWDAVIPATPVRDTVKRVSGETVLGTEDRESLRLVQTPQVFRFGAILEDHRRASREGFLGTDDASLAERYGRRVRWIEGPAHNLKVTVPEDVALLSELARRRSG